MDMTIFREQVRQEKTVKPGVIYCRTRQYFTEWWLKYLPVKATILDRLE